MKSMMRKGRVAVTAGTVWVEGDVLLMPLIWLGAG